MCPELFTHLMKEELSPDLNMYKADLFSLGLVILEAGLMDEL